MPYGSAAGVASLTTMWTDAGSFTTTTQPTLAAVTGWLTEISNLVDLALEQQWFETPIGASLTAARSALGAVVNAWVADMVHNANGSGRFATERAIERGISPMMTIRREITQWAKDNADGLVGMGLSQKQQPSKKNQINFGVWNAGDNDA